MKNKLIPSVLIGILCLSICLGLWIAYYVKDSVSSNIFVLSFQKEHAFFTADDIKFLNSKSNYFTFYGKADIEISSEMVRGKVEVIGTNENFADVNKLKIMSGSFFNEIQEKKLSNVVVISSAAAWKFFGYINCVGNFIDINNERYQVVGVSENNFVNKDKELLYIPFGKLEKYSPKDSFISDVFLNLNNISEVEPIVKMMGYLPEDVEVFQMEQYKDIIMQRVSIIFFIIGLFIIICFLKRILKNIRLLKQEIGDFSKENYAINIWLLIKQKRFLFELCFFTSNTLTVFLILKIIQFKVCLPYYFFSFGILDLSILNNMLNFFIQPNINISVLQYLNTLNLASNFLFFVSILSGLAFILGFPKQDSPSRNEEGLKKIERVVMMKVKRTLLAFAVLLIGMASTGVNAYGKNETLDDLKTLAESNILGAKSLQNELQYAETQKQYQESLKQVAISKMMLDQLQFKQTYDSHEKTQQSMQKKYEIQVEYYRISTLIGRLELAKDEATLADKQINAVREQLYQGESIQLDVDEAIVKKQQIENKIADLAGSITEKQNNLKILLNDGKNDNYSVTDVRYEIPIKVTIADIYGLDELINVCTKNNLELLIMRNDITLYNTLIKNFLSYVGSDDSSYKNAVLENDKMQDDAKAVEQKIIAYAERQYNAFRKILAEYKANQELRVILVKKIEILKSTYVVGTISEIQYLSTRISLMEAINNIDFAVADLINAKETMDLIANGII